MRHLLSNLKKRVAAKSKTEAPFDFSHSESFHEQNVDNVVFIDNRFQNGFDQVLHYFTSGFLKAENTLVIFKYYPANFINIRQICDLRNIHWFCFTANRFIPKFIDKLILYPFNSSSNAMMVANRHCYHVLLMHGESNKVACIKPLARIYDYILVAGDLACERLVEYGIFTHNDVQSGRIIKIGQTVMGNFEGFQLKPFKDHSTTLGYFPTWEGGNDEENICSLEHIEPALISALKTTKAKHVVMHLHPHTGDRLRHYRTYAIKLIQTLIEEGYNVTYAVINHPTSFELTLKKQFKALQWHAINENKPFQLSGAIVDVSALEAVLDAKLIPNLVYVNPKKNIAPPKRYWELKQNKHILNPEMTLPFSGFPINKHEAEIYRSALIGYSDDKLEAMTHSERLEWLNNYVRQHIAWP